MPTPNLSILLATEQSSLAARISTSLQQAGYSGLRHCGFAEARQALAQQPASVLLTEGDEGLALASHVQQQDETSDHHTYVLLISERAPEQLLGSGQNNGIDDVIAPQAVGSELLNRLLCADRLSGQLQRLRQENRRLRDNIASLEQRNLVDSLTGLGNARYLRQKLIDSLRQIHARGGALCYLLIGIEQAFELQRNHGNDFHRELMQSIARRLQQMVRPLDVLARLDDQHFVLLTLPADLQECAPSSFKRLHEGLNSKGFQTREGMLAVHAGISLIGVDASSLPLDPQTLFEEARALLGFSYASGGVSAKRMPRHN